MKMVLVTMAFASLCSLTAVQTTVLAAGRQQLKASPARNAALEKAALTQRAKIRKILTRDMDQKLTIVLDGFVKRLLRERKAVPEQIVREELRRQFGPLSPAQADVLSFYVASGVIEKLPAIDGASAAAREKGKDDKDDMSELSDQDMLMLQQMMEQKNQLETMISNLMKAGLENAQTLIQALKAS